MSRAQRVARAFDLPQRVLTRRRAIEAARVIDQHDLVRKAVDDQPGRRTAGGSGLEIEVTSMGMGFDVFEQAQPQGQLLGGAAVEHNQLPSGPPPLLGFITVAVEGSHRCPGHQRPYAIDRSRIGGSQQRGAATTAVADQADPRGIHAIAADTMAQAVQHGQGLLQLAAVGIAPKGVQVRGAIVAWTLAGAGVVETHDGKTTIRQQATECREEAPFHEALETVADDHYWTGAGSIRPVEHAREGRAVRLLESDGLFSHWIRCHRGDCMPGAAGYAVEPMTITSPLASLHQRLGAQFEAVPGASSVGTGDRKTPLSFGDPAGEYRALRETCGLVDRSEVDRLVITDTDRQRFLGGLVTCDVGGLATGQGIYGFFTDIKGRLLGDLVATADDERMALELPPGSAEDLSSHILKYRIADRVDIATVPQPTTVTLLGPAAPEVLSALAGTALPGETWSHICADLADTRTMIIRDGRFGVPAWSLWMAGDPVPRIEALLDAGRVLGLEAVGSQALERLRIEEGRPRFGQDMGSANFPQETGLGDESVSYTKGCYLGQEIVARIHYRGSVNRRLCGLRFADSAAQPLGADLLLHGRPTGTVTSFVRSDHHGPIGLAILHRRAEDGATLQVADGGRAEVVPLPFPG